MYALPNIQVPFFSPGSENQMLHSNDIWNHFSYPYSTFPASVPLTDTRQFFNSGNEPFSDTLPVNGQNYEEPSFESIFQHRNGDHLQVNVSAVQLLLLLFPDLFGCVAFIVAVLAAS
ncbi:hypothetical protein scyTo_0015365 [Scyliorhinus torazame]|uniref:Uncharacterized protein n=1 Tax=Scyliorhinus torazame TaxID=75743 RepID=A0A401PRG7_SCYTO|nr:hypothetical protein [Scyliorhinus torazame]